MGRFDCELGAKTCNRDNLACKGCSKNFGKPTLGFCAEYKRMKPSAVYFEGKSCEKRS